jgi:DNA helicase HerA-like ATPase
MSFLELSKILRIPASAITETFAILAARGAGKSNTAAVMAEEMFKAGLPFVVIDPVRAWWGLRSSRDGKGPGLPILIFGGKHGDVPLERGGGQLVADLIVDQRLTCVLDISEFESEAAKLVALYATLTGRDTPAAR